MFEGESGSVKRRPENPRATLARQCGLWSGSRGCGGVFQQDFTGALDALTALRTQAGTRLHAFQGTDPLESQFADLALGNPLTHADNHWNRKPIAVTS